MSQTTNRRNFLQASAAAGVGYWVAGGVQAQQPNGPNAQLQVGCIGVSGKGDSDVRNMSEFGKIFALCDVDASSLKGSESRYKTGHTFSDFREMLDQLGDKIDAVTVSVPDHNHAVAAAKAMKMGKHVYCQKPLTHTIWEARRLGEIAKEKGVVTQMGNQYTALNSMRKSAAEIRAGKLGTIKELYVWTNRPVWPQGGKRPASKPTPTNLNWDAWIGPAPFRPYGDGYHPFAWRGWWDFGTGALGDMACHTCNLPNMALSLRDPISVEAETAGHNNDSYPAWSMITFEFPKYQDREAFTMHWYDGGKLPPKELFEKVTITTEDGRRKRPAPSGSGVLFVGDKASLYAAGDYAEQGTQIIGEPVDVEAEYVESPGHEQEWFQAIRDPKKTKAMSNFAEFAGPLTETILLGNLAVWKGGKVEWDAKTLTPKNDPELAKIVHTEYRDGYEV